MVYLIDISKPFVGIALATITDGIVDGYYCLTHDDFDAHYKVITSEFTKIEFETLLRIHGHIK